MIDLTKFRKDFGLTQRDLAEALEISQGFLSSVENGRSSLPAGRLELLKEQYPKFDIDAYTVKESEPVKRSLNAILKNFIERQFEEDAEDDDVSGQIIESVDSLVKKKIAELNDKLYEARNKVYELQMENIRLRELISRIGNSNMQQNENSGE